MRAHRILLQKANDSKRLPSLAIICGLLANADKGKVKLEQDEVDRLSDTLRDQSSECKSTKTTTSD
jgi:hypothetical protein